MKIIQMVPEGKRKPDGFMISVTTEEAYKLIASLAHQLSDESANACGREEFFAEDGLYFSIAVDFQKEWKERKLKMDAYSEMLKKKFEEEGWLAVNDEIHGTNLTEQLEGLDDTKDNKRRKRPKTKV